MDIAEARATLLTVALAAVLPMEYFLTAVWEWEITVPVTEFLFFD